MKRECGTDLRAIISISDALAEIADGSVDAFVAYCVFQQYAIVFRRTATCRRASVCNPDH